VASTRRAGPASASMDPGAPIRATTPPDTSTSATRGTAASSPLMTVAEVKRMSDAMMPVLPRVAAVKCKSDVLSARSGKRLSTAPFMRETKPARPPSPRCPNWTPQA